jgi:glucosylceramidase
MLWDSGARLGAALQRMAARLRSRDRADGLHRGDADDLPDVRTDYGQRHFSVAHDEAEILPLLRALYLTKFVEAYREHGVTVNAITVQNEPQNRTPSGYPGTDMPSHQEEKVIEALGPMLRAAGLRTTILAYDHNWSEHPNDIANTPPDETQDINDYPQQVLSSPAARWVSGTAYHCYFGDPSAMTALHQRFPTKDIYFTECSGSQSSDPANTFSDTLKWHSRNLIIGSPRNWAKTVINWNVALDPTGGPHVGGCDTCTGIITVGPGDTVTPNAEYYTLGHLSRFVPPGAVRIASTSFGTTGWNGQVMDVAFQDPDGTTVLVAHNENDNPQAFGVVVGDRSFTYTLPGASLATFTWPAVPSAGLRSLDPSGWTASADPSGPTDPCCQDDIAAHAVDDDASTRYATEPWSGLNEVTPEVVDAPAVDVLEEPDAGADPAGRRRRRRRACRAVDHARDE